MDACALFMTTWRFCKATSVFCFTTVRLAPWPDRRASFSRLKLESCVYKEGEKLISVTSNPVANCITPKRHRLTHGAEAGPDLLTTGASCPVAHAGLKRMTIFLPQPPECWDYKQTAPCQGHILFLP